MVEPADHGVHVPGDPVTHRLERIDASRHVGDLLLHRAEVRDRLLELLSLLGVVGRDLQRALHGTEDTHAELEAADVQDVERDLVTASDLAEQVLLGHPHVFEAQRARRRALDAHLVLLGPRGEPVVGALDQERRERFTVDLREDREQVGEPRVRDPHLRAVEAVVAFAIIAGLQHRRRLGAEGVRTATRLRQRVRRKDLSGREPRQIPALLLVVAEEDERERSDARVRPV